MTTQMNAAVNEVRKLLDQGKPLTNALSHAVHRYGVDPQELAEEHRKYRNAWKEATFVYRYGVSQAALRHEYSRSEQRDA
jgi:hypothetical protein